MHPVEDAVTRRILGPLGRALLGCLQDGQPRTAHQLVETTGKPYRRVLDALSALAACDWVVHLRTEARGHSTRQPDRFHITTRGESRLRKSLRATPRTGRPPQALPAGRCQ
jgi:hypothetical protein